MQQPLLSVVKQLAHAETVLHRAYKNNHKRGTLILQDAYNNECSLYDVPAELIYHPKKYKEWLEQQFQKWATVRYTMRLWIKATMLKENSALLLTKYCALVLNDPFPRSLHYATDKTDIVVDSSNNIIRYNNHCLHIKEISTDLNHIKYCILRHGI